MEKITKIKINGEEYEIAGESAYDIAVKNGFEGTEAEWLTSLKGDDGGYVFVSGEWVFNEVLNKQRNDVKYDIRFTSNGHNFVSMRDLDVKDAMHYYYDEEYGIKAYDADMTPTWYPEAYRTVDFGTTPQAVTVGFYNWLATNATPMTDNAEGDNLVPISGVWVFNETLNKEDNNVTYNANFSSKGSDYVGIQGNSAGRLCYVLGGNRMVEVFNPLAWGVWNDKAYRHVDFGKTPQLVSEDFYKWFTQKAVFITTDKDYVTPEMYSHLVKSVSIEYNAIRKNGDVVENLSKTMDDWSDAIQSAVDDASRNQKTVLLTQLYYIDKPIEIVQTVRIIGASAPNPNSNHTLIKTDVDGVKRNKFPCSCGFIHRTTAIRLKRKFASDNTEIVGAGVGIKLDNIYFAQAYKESDPSSGGYRTIDVFLEELTNAGGANAIEVYPSGSGNFSKLSITNCNFVHTAGYAVKFMPVAKGENSYHQMFEFKNNSCWYGCGGVICAKTEDAELATTKGLYMTCATLDNINFDDSDYTSEFVTESLIDLSGMREYTLTNVVLEGGGAERSLRSLVRISNSRFQTINGIHAELGKYTYDYAIEVAQSLYLGEGSKNGSLFLYNVPMPMLVSASNSEVHVFGVYSASKDTNARCFNVTGAGSSVIVDTMMINEPTYNIFSPNDMGKITYKNFSKINSTDKLPVSFDKPITIFEWNAKKGALYDDNTKAYFDDDYYCSLIPAKANWDLDNSGLVYDDELGYVYRIKSSHGNIAQLHIRFVGNAQKNALLGKRATLSVTYRATTSGDTTAFNVSSYLGGYAGGAFINNSIKDEVAIGVSSVIVNDLNYGFVINGITNNDGNQYMDIIGIKISIGDEVEGMPLVFSTETLGIDLTDYVKKTDYEADLDKYVKETDHETDLAECVKKTDYASTTTTGVMLVGEGLTSGSNGKVNVKKAEKTDIDSKTHNYKPITPVMLDYALKVGITTNTEVLTVEEKAKAKEWLGADSASRAGIDTRKVGVELGDDNHITLSNLDYAVKSALTSNSEVLTERDKIRICKWLGAVYNGSFKLSGTWILNKTIESTTLTEDGVCFESNDMQYSVFMILNSDLGLKLFAYITDITNGTTHNIAFTEDAENPSLWTITNEADRRITFAEEQPVTEEFYNWFTANAVKQ